MDRDEINPPVLIIGFQRSGTTMARLMINSHPNIAVPFETGFFARYQRAAERYGDLSDAENAKAALRDIAGERFAQFGKLITDEDEILAARPGSMAELIDSVMLSYARRQGKQRWGDKSPEHNEDIDVLATMFPDAKIIHVIRDGRDVALSHKSVSWASRHLPKVAREWNSTTILCDKIGGLLGSERYLLVHYEDLVRNTETVLRKICTFIDEPYSEQMLDYHETARQAMPERSLEWHQNSVSRPDPSKCFAWKTRLPEADVKIFDEIAQEALRRFGYEVGNGPSSFGTKVRKLYYAVVARY